MRLALPAGAVRLFCNALRVMGGSGRPSCVLDDLRDAAAEMPLEPDAEAALENGLQSWRDDAADFQSQRYFEDAICAASLRIVAARSQGNSAECARAQGDMWGVVLQWRQKQADEFSRLHSAASAEAEAGKPKSSVYFIGDNAGHIKIGKAVSPIRRLSNLQCGHAGPLRLIATIPGGHSVERRLHRKFKKHRVGGEWFADCPEIQAFISERANDNSAQI